jgi:phage terminase large subunit-like protein
MLALDREHLEALLPSDLAAIRARERWVRKAHDPERTRKAGGVEAKQIPPETQWDQLIFRSGRGFGKTESLTEFAWFECWRVPNTIGHAVAPTLGDLKTTLMEGPAGLRAVTPAEILAGGSWEQAYNSSDHKLYFANGSSIIGFGAVEQGGRLRGPQCHFAIGDELREWDRPAGNLEFAHNNMMLGVRLPYPDGTRSRAVLATTPKAIPYLLNLYRRKGVIVVGGSTYENTHNLADNFKNVILSMEGTQMGKQEIYGQDVDTELGGIFRRNWFRLWPANKKLPEFSFILISLDTAFSEEDYDTKRQERDYSACSVYGIFNVPQCFTDKERRALGVKSKYAALLCDFWMERLGFPELLDKVRETYKMRWGPRGKKADIVLIESPAGISLRQTLVQYGVPTWPFNPGHQDKTMRAHAAAPIARQGMIWMPESTLPDRKGQVRDWAEPLLEQLCAFAGKGSIQFDDGLDSTTQAILYFMAKDMLVAEPPGGLTLDPDEKEEQQARRALDEQARRERANRSPYGA